MNMTMIEIARSVTQMIEERLEDCVRVKAKDIGLDYRAGSKLWVDTDCDVIIVERRNVGSLDYYGGFEYVNEDARVEFEDYVMFTDSCDRVEDALEAYRVMEDEDE